MSDEMKSIVEHDEYGHIGWMWQIGDEWFCAPVHHPYSTVRADSGQDAVTRLIRLHRHHLAVEERDSVWTVENPQPRLIVQRRIGSTKSMEAHPFELVLGGPLDDRGRRHSTDGYLVDLDMLRLLHEQSGRLLAAQTAKAMIDADPDSFTEAERATIDDIDQALNHADADTETRLLVEALACAQGAFRIFESNVDFMRSGIGGEVANAIRIVDQTVDEYVRTNR